MKYLVLEIQVNEGITSNLVYDFENQRQAESKYHTVLAAAAISNLDVHTAMLTDENGFLYETRSYKKIISSEPTPEINE